RKDPIILTLSVFCWSCMIDLGIGLEVDGLISNFIGFYFVEGEPYLYTAHGALICYWDGIVHYVLGLIVIILYCQGRNYQEIALYWVGSILNSMIVLLPGAVTGNNPFKLSILLNTPYIILPLLAGFKLLHERPVQITPSYKFDPIWKRPVDFLFIIYFTGAIIFSLFRGLAVLNGNAEIMKQYLRTFEPYLSDESNFPKFQMLAYGYFFLVYYLGAIYALLYPGQNWMTDWSIIHAGAAAQGQFSYIVGSFHHRTPSSLRSPTRGFPAIIFWTANLTLLIVPQVFLWWCKQNREMYGCKTSWPVGLTLTKLDLMKEQVAVFIAGVLALSLATIVPYFLFSKCLKRNDPLVLTLSVFCWSCMIDLGIGLELDGYISNFIGFYFAEGEPYLFTAHGTLINYWDGTVHYGLGLAIIILYCKKQSYRDVALYWVGSIMNSMVVLLPGAVAGNHPFKLSILLNTPYLLLPLFAGFKLLHERRSQSKQIPNLGSILQRPVDFLFFLYFIIAIAVSIFRVLAVLGGNAELMKDYTQNYEPYLMDKSNFPKFQMLAYGYFYLVYYLAATYALLCPAQNWMTDWSIIHAGASAQGQFSYIVGSVHHRTPASMRAPNTGLPAMIFWTVNLTLLVIPHVFMWWCKKNINIYGHSLDTKKDKHLKMNNSLKKLH
ncbi:Transmembrane 6 super member 1, partial [Bulinus truncatus]